MNRNTVLLILISTFIITAFSGCYDNPASNPEKNKAPNTYLFLYPDSTIAEQRSKLTVSWWGDDPDGLIIGYYFKWEGIDTSWHFTTSNDSTFILPIGSADTTYNFLISAVDNLGNDEYDRDIIQNGINYGPEPFIDRNGNGKYDKGETFYDIGLIDPTPAELKFPIKNTAPEISWSQSSVIPDTSFPVMSFGWVASDLDGEETIIHINIALNDTNNFVALDGGTRLITLRTHDFTSPDPEMEILINGSDQNIFPQSLPGLILNGNNVFFVQAVDLSGAKTEFIRIPDSAHTWYVKKPKSRLLLVDDYNNLDASTFYVNAFNSLNGGSLVGKYDIYKFSTASLPYQNVTFPETMDLFKYIFWYSGSQPKIDLLSLFTNKFLMNGGRIMFSLTLLDSSATFSYDVPTLKSFIPIDSLSYNKAAHLLPPAYLEPAALFTDYPSLVTTANIGQVRLFYPSITAKTVYNLNSQFISGPIGFLNDAGNLFFVGLPLHVANGNMNVTQLLEKVFLEVFGLVP